MCSTVEIHPAAGMTCGHRVTSDQPLTEAQVRVAVEEPGYSLAV